MPANRPLRRGQLAPREFERLVSALALCFGWEAFLVLKDVRGLSLTEGEEVSSWAARTLLRAALEEAEGRRRRKGR